MSGALPFLRKHAIALSWVVLLALLLLKFLLPYFRFDMPLGYDPGIYRYLFLRYSEAFPHLPDLPLWAKEHPAGLFLIAAPFLRLGLPVDMLLGWIWNLVPVLLAAIFAFVIGRQKGHRLGVLLLVAAFLAQAYFDGFVGMYWKTYVALLFMVLALASLERLSFWFPVFAFLTFIIHHQTGLLLGLVAGSWLMLTLPRRWNDPKMRWIAGGLLLVFLLAAVFYLPQWKSAVRDPFLSIFVYRGSEAPGGSFPDPSYYFKITGILLGFGVWGFLQSLRREWGTPWQLAVLWTLPFILLKLVFYRRFFLQLDFFLFPFAALGILDLWQRGRQQGYRVILVAVVLFQAALSFQGSSARTPLMDDRVFDVVAEASKASPEDPLIVLDNVSAPWILGWLPERSIGGPGLFNVPGWTYPQWEAFIYGSHEEREELLRPLPSNTHFLLTPFFMEHYGVHAESLLTDTCLRRVSPTLFQSLCSDGA